MPVPIHLLRASIPEVKIGLLTRLSRPAQVAFETYALAREVAVSVLAQLR